MHCQSPGRLHHTNCKQPSSQNSMKTHKKGKDVLTADKQDSSCLGDTVLLKREAFVPGLEPTNLSVLGLLKQHPLVPSCCLTIVIVSVDTRWFSYNSIFLF